MRQVIVLYGIVLRRPSLFARSEYVQILGVRFYMCYVGREPFSRGAAARRLRRRGVYDCIFQESFRIGKAFARRGIAPVATEPLVREMAAVLCLAERERRGLCGPVAIHAASGDEVKRTVEELLPRVRHISLGTMRGRERLCADFLYEKGAVLSFAEREELAEAETLLLFAPPGGFTPENALTVRLYGDAEPRFALSEELEKQLPPELPRLGLMAALYRAGAIQKGDIFPLCD